MDLKIKKIAILCNYELLPERVGGMDYFFWAFDVKCKENGVAIDWFFPNVSKHGAYSHLNIIDAKYKNAEVFFVEYSKRNNENYHFIITHFVELCTPFFKRISKLSEAKIIAVDHNPRPLGGYPLKKKILKKIKGILYSKYINLFIGVSKYTTNEILKDFGSHLKNKTQTIYNGVITDDIVMKEQRNYSNPSFLVVSHLRESKGIQDLTDAVALLPESIKTVINIDIYGDGPYKATLLERMESKKVVTNFKFKGSVANLKAIFHNYDYMLQPSHMECFSLSIIESLAANIPVITTDVGGNAEVITDGMNGYILQAKNVEALKNIIQSMYLGDKKIEINTRPLIENCFSLKKMVEKHWELIRE